MTKQFIKDQINSKQRIMKSEKKKIICKTIFYFIVEIIFLILFNFFDEIRLQVALSIFYSFMFSLKMIIIESLKHSKRVEVKIITRPPQSWCYVEEN